MEHLAQTSDVPPPDETTIARMLETLVNERLMAHLDGRYLSLALRSA
jgi:hypothetical protein